MEQFLSILALLGILAGTLYLSYWVSKKLAGFPRRGAGGGCLRVVDRVQTGRDTAVLILEVQSAYYLVGVADKSVTLLGKLDALEIPEPQTGEQPAALRVGKDFQSILTQVLTLRRSHKG